MEIADIKTALLLRKTSCELWGRSHGMRFIYEQECGSNEELLELVQLLVREWADTPGEYAEQLAEESPAVFAAVLALGVAAVCERVAEFCAMAEEHANGSQDSDSEVRGDDSSTGGSSGET